MVHLLVSQCARYSRWQWFLLGGIEVVIRGLPSLRPCILPSTHRLTTIWNHQKSFKPRDYFSHSKVYKSSKVKSLKNGTVHIITIKLRSSVHCNWSSWSMTQSGQLGLKDWFHTRPWTPSSDTIRMEWRPDRPMNLTLPIQTMDYNFLDTGTNRGSLVDFLSLRSG